MNEPFVSESAAVLARTPSVLSALLGDLPESWTTVTEGPGTWNPYDVVGHLIHGEKTDWMQRITIILEHGADMTFPVFDRTAQFRESEGKALALLLEEFRDLRAANLQRLADLHLGPEQLELAGMHPGLGRVTMRQLIATWVAHDLDHLVQMSRAMARRYRDDVGPWAAYLSVLR
jgi:hypothetical protein